MSTINLDETLKDAERRLEKARQTFVSLLEEVADIRIRIARYDLGWGEDGTS